MRYAALVFIATMIGTLAGRAVALQGEIDPQPKRNPDCSYAGQSCGNMNGDCDTMGGSCTTSGAANRWHDPDQDGCGCLI